MRVPGVRVELTPAHLSWMRIPDRFWMARSSAIGDGFKDLIFEYLRSIDKKLDDGTGLILWGANGTGKTAASVVIAKVARSTGASVLFITAESFRQATLDNEKFDDGLLVKDRALEVDVLVLDDLGKEHSGDSTWAERTIENLVRVRSSKKRTTIVTTNLNPDQMLERYKLSLMEVLLESCIRIQTEGKSVRKAPSL